MTSDGDYSIAIGFESDVSEEKAVGVGYRVNIDNAKGVAIGTSTTVQGDNSIALGANTTVSAANSIAIGAGVTVANPNEVKIGNSAMVSIGGAVNWTATSDGRFKKNVQENIPGLNFVTKLRPVTYQFDTQKMDEFYGQPLSQNLDKDKIRYTGFIAQEVAQIAKNTNYDFSGIKIPSDLSNDAYGIRYAEFVVPLVQAVKELSERSERQQKIIDEQNDLLAQNELLIRKQQETLAAFAAAIDQINLEEKSGKNK